MTDALDALFAADAAAQDRFLTPFDDAISYHRQKINLPTQGWRDIEGRAHDRYFTVAGVTSQDMLADLNKEVDNAIAKGETLQSFQKRLDEIATKNGWLQDKSAKARAWRARVIYETNVRTANQAGRRKQMLDPDVLRVRPYWRYVHGELREPLRPRPMHLAWDGTVLLATDPWWDTHYGPNGWFCTCGVVNMTRRELARMGKTQPDTAPDDGTRKVLNSSTGEFEDVPNGIDPGWDHAPGKDWLDGLSPAPVEPAPAAAPSPAVTKSFLQKVRQFLAEFLSADHADEAAPIDGVVFVDALGLPLALSPAMFMQGRKLVATEALAASLPAVGAAIRTPREIRLAWIAMANGRKELARVYVGDDIVVTWTKSAWRTSDQAPAGAIAAWERS